MSAVVNKSEEKDKILHVRNSSPFILLDRKDKNYIVIDLVQQFGFKPDKIIIERSPGSPFFMLVRAILTKEEIEKEKAMSVKKT